MNRGILYGLAAYSIWGLLPLYWKALAAVPPLQILSHRMFWLLAVVLLLLICRRQWKWLTSVGNLRLIAVFISAAVLLAVNWFVYIWAVNTGRVIETSLGYFINPLVNVILGVLFFGETLRLRQWIAVALAIVGVTYLTLNFGSLPWIALTLAFSFAFYGVLKKRAPLGALEGLSLETALLAPAALTYLIWVHAKGTGAFGSGNVAIDLLLIGAGVATAVPLLCFAAAARRVPLSTLGFMQYLAPTLQLILGVLVFKEPFTAARLVGFSFIWAALSLYSIDGMIAYRRRLQPQFSN